VTQPGTAPPSDVVDEDVLEPEALPPVVEDEVAPPLPPVLGFVPPLPHAVSSEAASNAPTPMEGSAVRRWGRRVSLIVRREG
jgi:hypothetical protein